MKKIISLLLLAFTWLQPFAQVKISDLPSHTGNPAGGLIPLTIGGTTKKYDAGNFLYSGGSYGNPSWITSLHPNKLSSAGASNGQALIWTGSQWAPGNIVINYPAHTHIQSQIIGLADSLLVRMYLSDTASMLSGYTRIPRFIDTADKLQARIQTKEPLLGFTPEDHANKVTDFSTVNNTLFPSIQAVVNYTQSALTGVVKDMGNYDASGDAFPSSGGSGSGGAIKKGDMWYISVKGKLGSDSVYKGDWIRALVDAPGSTAANWAIAEGNFGFTPENSANKSTNTSLGTSNTLYPTQNAVKSYVDAAIALTKPANDSLFNTGFTSRWQTKKSIDSLAALKVSLQTGALAAQTGKIGVTDTVQTDGRMIANGGFKGFTSNPSGNLLDLSFSSGNSLSFTNAGGFNVDAITNLNGNAWANGTLSVSGKLTGSDSIVTSSGIRAKTGEFSGGVRSTDTYGWSVGDFGSGIPRILYGAEAAGTFSLVNTGNALADFAAAKGTFGGNVVVTGGGIVAGSMWKSGVSGLALQAVAGSAFDFNLVNPSATVSIMKVPTGTNNAVFGGTLAVKSNVSESSGWETSAVTAGYDATNGWGWITAGGSSTRTALWLNRGGGDVYIGGNTYISQDIIAPSLSSGTQSNVVYYNTSTGQLTYGAAPGGGTSGQYTPTFTGVSNVASYTSTGATYLRVGNAVTVSGIMNIQPSSANTATYGYIQLPISSSLSNGAQDGNGTFSYTPGGSTTYSGFISVSSNQLVFYFNPPGTNNYQVNYHFTYYIN